MLGLPYLENTMKEFRDTLDTGEEIYIPTWPVDVALQNLTSAGMYLGGSNMVAIAERDEKAFIVALTSADDPENTYALIEKFVSAAAVSGEKAVTPAQFKSMYNGNLALLSKVFCAVVHANYHDFFESGLTKAPSQSQSDKEQDKK